MRKKIFSRSFLFRVIDACVFLGIESLLVQLSLTDWEIKGICLLVSFIYPAFYTSLQLSQKIPSLYLYYIKTMQGYNIFKNRLNFLRWAVLPYIMLIILSFSLFL
jgi:hypothetical protein